MEAANLSCTSHPRVECGINGNVMQRLEKEARMEKEKRIQLLGVTGEVKHEESSLQRGDRETARDTGRLSVEAGDTKRVRTRK